MCTQYAYLGCALFNKYPAPTLNEIKQHAQLIANEIISAPRTSGFKASDFPPRDKLIAPGGKLECLLDLTKPYISKAPHDPARLGSNDSSDLWKDPCGCELLLKGRNPDGILAALLQLKKHLQAIVAVVRKIVLTVERPENMKHVLWDWLIHIETKYNNNSMTHIEPIEPLRNTLYRPTAPDNLGHLQNNRSMGSEDNSQAMDQGITCQYLMPSEDTGQCDEGLPSIKILTKHADDLLTYLDHRLSKSGGLFSLMPPKELPIHEFAANTIFGQWLEHTTMLTRRVAEMEEELARIRDVLAGEALVPKQLLSSSLKLGPEVLVPQPLLLPQDTWVIANVTPGLIKVLNEKLDHHGTKNDKRGTSSKIGFVAPSSTWNHKPASTIAWADVQSRIFRLKNHDTFFIIPGFELHPNTQATIIAEGKPFIVTVPNAVDTDSRTVWEKEVLRRQRQQEDEAAQRSQAQLRRKHTQEGKAADAHKQERVKTYVDNSRLNLPAVSKDA